jgi:putative hydrolase of the HAD superfamily
MFSSGLVKDYELGRISSSAFGQGCAQRLNLDLSMEAIRQIWSDIFRPVEGMEELMCTLKERYTLVLLSNTNQWHFEHCRERYPVVSLFDRFALSYRLGCHKPDPAIYERALAMAGVRPDEALYLDDIPAYVEAAANLGVRAVRFENRAQLMKWLRVEGVR